MTTTWNPSDKSVGITLSGGDLTATTAGGDNYSVRANFSASTGKLYCEFAVSANDNNYYNGVGIAKIASGLGDNYAGNSGSLITEFGQVVINNANILGYPYVSQPSGSPPGPPYVAAMAVDLDAALIWFKIGSDYWNGSISADPATGVGGFDISFLAGVAVAPVMAASTATMTATANFGDSAYTYTPPSGFGPWALEVSSSDEAASDETDSDEAASSDHQHNVFWNEFDKSAEVTLSGGDLIAQATSVPGGGGCGVRATLGHNSGKKYFEVHIDEITGTTQFNLFGVGPGDLDLADFFGVYNGTTPGGAFMQMGFHDGGGHFDMLDITIAFAVDFRLRQCRFKVRVGNADYTGEWTGGGVKFAKGFQFPTLMLTNSGIGTQPVMTGNFGAQAFTLGIPAGFASWDGQQGADSGADPIYAGTVAIGGGNVSNTNQMIAYSRNAFDFTMATTPTFAGGAGVDYNLAASAKVFVGVSYSSTDAARAAVVSSDGITWTPATAAENNTWNSVCYAPEIPLFVAVASDGTNRVMTSPDGLPGNWTARSMPGSARSWQSVCWSPELHLFVAVANNGGGLTDTIASSPDGETWTLRTSPADRQWKSVIWVPDLGEVSSSGSGTGPTGLFIATPTGATGGNPDYATSPDGIDWDARDSGTGGAGWQMICWSVDIGRLVAVAHGGTINYSDDGLTWHVGALTGSPNFDGVGWSRAGQCFLALASGGEIFLSEDGTEWTEISEPASRSWHSFAEKLDRTETPSSALESFLEEHPSSSFSELVSSEPASSEVEPASSEIASSEASSSASEPTSSDLEAASSDHERASSDHEQASSDAGETPANPPPIQVVVILS